jgi:hypothetical protein
MLFHVLDSASCSDGIFEEIQPVHGPYSFERCADPTCACRVSCALRSFANNNRAPDTTSSHTRGSGGNALQVSVIGWMAFLPRHFVRSQLLGRTLIR